MPGQLLAFLPLISRTFVSIGSASGEATPAQGSAAFRCWKIVNRVPRANLSKGWSNNDTSYLFWNSEWDNRIPSLDCGNWDMSVRGQSTVDAHFANND